MKSNFGCSQGNYGNNLRDDILQFQLDNETGYKLVVDTSVENKATLSLLSKTGSDLGHGTIEFATETQGSITNVLLDSENKRLEFIFTIADPIYCDLTNLYNYIDTFAKQDYVDTLVATETSRATAVESTKVDKPVEPVAGQGVNIPYYFDVTYSVDKATVRDYTIDLLDNTKAPQVFSLDINSATNTTAGLMSASDKSNLDTINSDYLKASDKTELETKIATEEQARIAADNTKVTKPEELIPGNGVNVPYYFTVDYSTDKATVTDYTINLASNNELGQYDIDISSATQSQAGLMSSTDKTKLDGIEEGAQKNLEGTVVDSNYSHITVSSIDGVSDANGNNYKYDDTTITQNLATETANRISEDNKLDVRITSLEGRGRYLSGWNCTTGKPDDYPEIPEGSTYPYTYNFKAGDYYIVSNVPDEENKLIPSGQSITKPSATEDWVVQTTTSTDNIFTNDNFVYSTSGWSLIHTSVELLDTSVKLSSQLKTYYNIGKVTTASGTNPVIIGNAGDSIRDVLNNLTQMDEVQPTKVDPAINSVTFSASASDEYGTEISAVNYSISKSNGTYTYDTSTGVTWSNYNFSGGCESIDKTTTSGSLTLSSTYIVGSSSAVTFTCVGTHSAGNVAKTNLGNPSNPEVKIEAGTKTKTGTFSKTSVLYPYYMLSNDETLSTVAKNVATKSTQSACTSSGIELTTAESKYVWFILPNSYAQSKIQYEALGQWYDWTGGTSSVNTVSITLNSGGVKSDYKAYRTLTKMAVGTTKFRIIN